MRAVWMILGGLVALIAVIGLGGGFIIATTILFATTATAFGRRAIAADLGIGFVLAFVIYIAFAKLLSLSLPLVRWSGCSDSSTFALQGLTAWKLCIAGPGHAGRDPALQPALRADRCAARHRCRRAAGDRPRADGRAAVARDLQARPRRIADHVRGHLLRRHVWRIDHRDPDQHARRERVDGTALEGNLMAKADAAVRRWQPPPSARSSPAPSQRLGWRFSRRGSWISPCSSVRKITSR